MGKLKFIAAWSAFVVLTACHTGKHVPGAVGLVPLNHYFVRNTVALPSPVNYMYFTSQEGFESHFGVATTSGNTIISPHFSGQVVVALALPPTNKKTEVHFDRAEIGGQDLNVYYSVSEQTGEQSFNHTPCAVATVPKSQSVKRLNFYNQGMKMKTLDVRF